MTPRAPETGVMGALVAVTLFTTLCMFATSTQAGLGRPYLSVEDDRQHFGARLQSTSTGRFTVHNMTLVNGGTVKEFTRADGTVFAVAWRGPGRPDLRQLLGDHFDAAQAAPPVRAGRRLRVPIGVNTSDLVIHTGGHPGAYWGLAVLPGLQPAGFTAGDMK